MGRKPVNCTPSSARDDPALREFRQIINHVEFARIRRYLGAGLQCPNRRWPDTIHAARHPWRRGLGRNAAALEKVIIWVHMSATILTQSSQIIAERKIHSKIRGRQSVK